MKVAIILCLMVACMASPSTLDTVYGHYPVPAYRPVVSYEGPAQYDFDYAVKDGYSGNDFGHRESRNGYDTQGSYSVLLPDGRLQTVTYTVNGDSGYVAHVSYQGVAHHPAHNPAPTYKPAPVYKPAPTYKPAPVYRPATVYG